MVKIHKLHKFFGLSAGLVVLILSITGFFLDHDNWNFLYTNTTTYYPPAIKDADRRLFTSYKIDPQNTQYRVVGSKRGLYESFDGGTSFSKILDLQINAMKRAKNGDLFLATSDGIYKKKSDSIEPFLLSGNYINAISLWESTLVVVNDKKTLFMIDIPTKQIRKTFEVSIDKKELQEDIKLSRFVRDLHYGRGLFDGELSLYINDFAAVILTLLGMSGFVIWYYIFKKKVAKTARKWIQYHANIFTILALFPVFILVISGIFLDHSSGLAKFMKSVSIPHTILPPVYDSLKSDIWAVDYDGKIVRIGNRYGVYQSSDLQEWHLESRGFAYSLDREKDTLYVGGMGSANRFYNGSWHYLPHTPHMFKCIVNYNGKRVFFSSHNDDLALPKFQDITLYSILLALHDGTFFSSWWIWVNDYAAVAMLVLFMTGIYRWWKKKQPIKKFQNR